MFIINLIVVMILSLLCLLVQSAAMLFIIRLFIGVIVGADYPIATSLVVEFSPRKSRSTSIGVLTSVWLLGAVVADLTGYVFGTHWKFMLGIGALYAFLLFLGRIGTPESPRWLMSKGRVEEARAVIKRLYGPDAEPEVEEKIAKTKYSNNIF